MEEYTGYLPFISFGGFCVVTFSAIVAADAVMLGVGIVGLFVSAICIFKELTDV